MKMGNLHRTSVFIIIAILLLIVPAACSQVDQQSIQETAMVMAATMNYSTHQAETALVTDTPAPSETPLPTITDTPSASPTFLPTMTGLAAQQGNTLINPGEPTLAQPSTAQVDDLSTPLSAYPTYTPLPFMAAWKQSSIRFVNSSGKQATVQLSGDQVINVTVGKSTIIKIRFGTYYYTIFIGKDGPYNGSVFINNVDRYTIYIDEGNIRVATP